MLHSLLGAILLALITFHSAHAAEIYRFDAALRHYQEQKLHLPTAENDGRIQTLNRKGAMSPQSDAATQQFIRAAKGKKVLEIGGAYGKVMLETLMQYPSTTYHLNDLDARHLFIAASRLAPLSPSTLKRTRFIAADITQPLSFQDQYDAILVARVLHFFSPSQLEAAISNLHHLLKPGGKIYVVAITPYVKRYERFIPEYERRVRQHVAFPGYVDSLKDWVNTEATSQSQLAVISKEPFMFLDDTVLTALFTQHGFHILECKTADLGYPSASWSLDGRENVILVAEK